jgi:hypothetical protein
MMKHMNKGVHGMRIEQLDDRDWAQYISTYNVGQGREIKFACNETQTSHTVVANAPPNMYSSQRRSLVIKSCLIMKEVSE